MKLCADCFNDNALKLLIEDAGVIDTCDVTGQSAKTIDTYEYSDTFDSLISSFKASETGTCLYNKIQNDWNLFNDEFGIQTLNGLIKEQKSSLSYNSIVEYSGEIQEAVNTWKDLKSSLINKYRFLSVKDIDYEEYYEPAFNVHSHTIHKGSKLFRSRINIDGDNHPIKKDEMGAPPTKLATAGRANPQGIPFLYLSDSAETTFYETRALYLDIISTGTFEVIKNLNIVDYSTNESPFNSIYSDVQTGIINELIAKKISQDLSKPMRRSDSPVDYVPTQFICEYIKYTSKVDGIAFQSSLYNGGINYVFFNTDIFRCIDVKIHNIDKVIIEERMALA